MAIEDQTATNRPPTVLFHKYSAKSDTLDDLNAWAVKHYSPQYSDDMPAFAKSAQGDGICYFNGADFNTPVIPDGWVIVLGNFGNLTIQAPEDFNREYVEVSA